jgi:hypothetical protein
MAAKCFEQGSDMSTNAEGTLAAAPDHTRQQLVALLQRVNPRFAALGAVAAETRLITLGFDSLGLASFFVELQRAFKLKPVALRSVLRRSCTFGDVCELIGAANGGAS